MRRVIWAALFRISLFIADVACRAAEFCDAKARP